MIVKKFKELYENNKDKIFTFIKNDDDFDFEIIINKDMLEYLSVGEGIDEINVDANIIMITFVDNAYGYVSFDEWKWLDIKYKSIIEKIPFFDSYNIIASKNEIELEFDDIVDDKSFGGFQILSGKEFDDEYEKYLKSTNIKKFKI